MKVKVQTLRLSWKHPFYVAGLLGALAAGQAAGASIPGMPDVFRMSAKCPAAIVETRAEKLLAADLAEAGVRPVAAPVVFPGNLEPYALIDQSSPLEEIRTVSSRAKLLHTAKAKGISEVRFFSTDGPRSIRDVMHHLSSIPGMETVPQWVELSRRVLGTCSNSEETTRSWSYSRVLLSNRAVSLNAGALDVLWGALPQLTSRYGFSSALGDPVYLEVFYFVGFGRGTPTLVLALSPLEV